MNLLRLAQNPIYVFRKMGPQIWQGKTRAVSSMSSSLPIARSAISYTILGRLLGHREIRSSYFKKRLSIRSVERDKRGVIVCSGTLRAVSLQSGTARKTGLSNDDIFFTILTAKMASR
jgi:hypothetical protein